MRRLIAVGARAARASLSLAAIGGGVAIAAIAATGCGDAGRPAPGGADVCATPAGPTLGCPATAQRGGGFGVDRTATQTPAAACEKLVSCGILAAKFLGRRGDACSNDGDCGTGECIADSQGTLRCHQHFLDYHWCVAALTARTSSPCPGVDPFDQLAVDNALRCMAQTPCSALGLGFDDKRRSEKDRGDVDRFTCKDGTLVFTATVCDHGLLEY